MNAFDAVCEKLAALQIPHQVLRHEPVFTSEAAARVRGTPLSSGAKALLLLLDGHLTFLVLPADRRLDSKLVRGLMRAKSSRFATREEVEAATGLQPGAIPPFGSLFGLKTWCDHALGLNATINFNAGDHSISIGMGFDDYVRAEQPELAALSKPAAESG